MSIKCQNCSKIQPEQNYYTVKCKNETHYMTKCKTCVDNIKKYTKELTCYKCNKSKNISNFRYRNDRHCYERICSECYINKQKVYTNENKDKISERDKKYYQNKKETVNKRNNEYYLKNKDIIQKQRKEYREKNKDKVKEQNKKSRENPHRKITDPMRRRISKRIRSNGNLPGLLGCDMDLLYKWFDFNFELDSYLNINWTNHGKLWHIDHVIPVCKFNHEIEDDMKICFNWTNYRPLLAKQNLSKNGKISKKDIFLQNLRLSLFIKKNNIQKQEEHNIKLWNIGVCRTALF
jgi:hypothetical protein